MASAAADAPKPPRPHPATRALRDALAALDEVGERLAPARPTYSNAREALCDGLDTPQYRRTYVQGCVCKTGIAGGGCCPAHAASAASVRGLPGQPTHMGTLHHGLAAAGAGLSLLGLISGGRVMRLSVEARSKLAAVAEVTRRQADTRVLQEATLAQHGALDRATEHVRAELSAALGLLAALDASQREQVYNLAVPGVVQSVASGASGLAALAHLGVGAAVGGVAACAAGGLFGVYGAAQAAKHFTVPGPTRDATRARLSHAQVPQAYREAVERHAHAQRSQHRRSGWAWSSVATASALSAAAALGLVSFPMAAAMIPAMALGGALWAMVESSRTRYVPHVPVSPHVAPANLITSQQRARVWEALQAQQHAISTAVEQMLCLQDRRVRALRAVERHVRPQCGPKSFRVLPEAAQHQPVHSPQRAQHERFQLFAAQTWVQAERALLLAQFSAQHDDLRARHAELRHLVDPCCKSKQANAREALSLGQATEQLYTQASATLRDDASALEHAARRLAALDLLDTVLEALRPHLGHLRSATYEATSTQAQRNWVDARLLLMQLQGSLGDAIPASLVRAQPALFRERANVLPLENIDVPAQSLPALARHLAPRLDAEFLHAFFNPRRTEGELDYVLARELDARSEKMPRAPACSGRTCCA